ncbi:MAG TPA: hypothetical protein VGL11_24775 [Candidatus Binatia bacterium]|jgi:hypothetical protein
MENPFLQELSALLQETEKLLACPEPDTAAWEDYRRMRRETFARLESAGSTADGTGEPRLMKELINAVLERDRLLMQKVEECLSCCREGLSTVPKARQALSGYLPPRRPSLVQRQA